MTGHPGGSKAWETQQKSYWNSVSRRYDQLYRDPWSKTEDLETLSELQRVLPQDGGHEVLDLGCGTGLGFTFMESLNRLDLDYVGIDVSDKMIDAFRRARPGVECRRVPMEECSTLGGGRFAAAFALNAAFSFASDPDRVLSGLHRTLKPGGRIMLSCLSRWSLRRIVRLKSSATEMYRTRNDNSGETTPARVYSVRSIGELLGQNRFSMTRITGQSLLGGVLEVSLFQGADQLAARRFPTFAHLLTVHAERM